MKSEFSGREPNNILPLSNFNIILPIHTVLSLALNGKGQLLIVANYFHI